MAQSSPAAANLAAALAEARFRRLYAEHSRDILAYALRRVSDPQDAADVVAETFLIAWRRGEESPSGPEARLWLYGVARGTLSNQRRGERRRERLAERLRTELAAAMPGPAAVGEGEEGVRDALSRLAPEDQEILRLVGWEELTPTEAARVLEISPIAARSRLHRARRRFRRELAPPSAGKRPSIELRAEEEQ